MIDLKFSENERPIVAQLFSGNPENMEFAAKLCVQLGFDGIDINMGCPDRSIEKSRSGAYAMKDIKLAKALLRLRDVVRVISQCQLKHVLVTIKLSGIG